MLFIGRKRFSGGVTDAKSLRLVFAVKFQFLYFCTLSRQRQRVHRGLEPQMSDLFASVFPSHVFASKQMAVNDAALLLP